jgi:hypothetical protein
MARPKKKTELEMLAELYRIAAEYKIKDILRGTTKLYTIDGYNVREEYCSTLTIASDYFHTEVFLQKRNCNWGVDKIFKLSGYWKERFFTKKEAAEYRNSNFRKNEF